MDCLLTEIAIPRTVKEIIGLNNCSRSKELFLQQMEFFGWWVGSRVAG
jgi:hypothetical protein